MPAVNPPTASVRQNILNFLRAIVSKRIYRAIELILSPCCPVSILSVDVVCNEDDEYDITVTLDSNISLLGIGKYQLFFEVDGVLIEGNFTNGNTITVTGQTLTSGTTDVSGYLFLPTNSDATVGAFLDLGTIEATVPAC